MADDLDKDLEHIASDLDQIHEEVEHLKKEHPFNVEETKHINNLDDRLHHTLGHTKEIKKSNSFIHFNRSLHKWLGLALSIVILTLSVTGIMLNHKTSMGYMPDVKHDASGQISQSLTIEKVAMIAIKAADNKDIKTVKDIDRIDYRTKNMFAKVRFKDTKSTEVTVDSVTGEILNVGYRTDVFISGLHSGAIFGANFKLISDVAAISLVLLIFSGIYIWIFPKRRRRLNEKSVKERNVNLKSQLAFASNK
jgi:hypothetical protein